MLKKNKHRGAQVLGTRPSWGLKFCLVESHTCGSSIRNFYCVSPVIPRILMWLLDICEMYVSLRKNMTCFPPKFLLTLSTFAHKFPTFKKKLLLIQIAFQTSFTFHIEKSVYFLVANKGRYHKLSASLCTTIFDFNIHNTGCESQ